MSATGHSKFSASSAYRLLACPGSYKLGQDYGSGRRATVFSAEGTLAHSLSEAALYSGADLSGMIGRTFAADGFEFTVDEGFVEAIQTYVAFITNLQALGYLIALETQVSPTIHWRPAHEPDLGVPLFGTADCIAYHPGTGKLLIVDLKFGKGVAVEVKDNAQFLYYAAGSLSSSLIDHIAALHGVGAGRVPLSSVETIVVQPRAYHPDGPIRRATYTVDEVIDWTRTVLYPGVQRATTDNGQTLNAGEHCRFCPALAQCPAYAKMLNQQAKDHFAALAPINAPIADSGDLFAPPTLDPALTALPDVGLSDAELGDLLDKVSLLKPYFAAIEALAEQRLKANAQRPKLGWKLVPTRTRRVWADDEPTIVAALHNHGVAPGQYTETRLLSPTQVEKRLGRDQFKQVLAALPLVKQSTPGLALAPEGDPRARVSTGRSAKEAFGLAPPSP